MIYGNCRVSTPSQNIERQVRNIIRSYGSSIKLYKDVWTGTTADRPEWNKLLKRVKNGDIIVFDSVSRMSRNADEGYQQWQELYEAGVDLAFLNEPHINTQTYKEGISKRLSIDISSGDEAADKLMKSISVALNDYMLDLAKRQIRLAFEESEKEVMDLRERTKGGMETARINGKKIGRPIGSKSETKKSIETKKKILAHSKDFGGTLTDADIIQICGISRDAYYRYKRQLKSEAKSSVPAKKPQ